MSHTHLPHPQCIQTKTTHVQLQTPSASQTLPEPWLRLQGSKSEPRVASSRQTSVAVLRAHNPRHLPVQAPGSTHRATRWARPCQRLRTSCRTLSFSTHAPCLLLTIPTVLSPHTHPVPQQHLESRGPLALLLEDLLAGCADVTKTAQRESVPQTARGGSGRGCSLQQISEVVLLHHQQPQAAEAENGALMPFRAGRGGWGICPLGSPP